jgi:hypothetical protein
LDKVDLQMIQQAAKNDDLTQALTSLLKKATSTPNSDLGTAVRNYYNSNNTSNPGNTNNPDNTNNS